LIVPDDVRVGSNRGRRGLATRNHSAALLVMGMPARVKRPLTDEEVAGLDRYWQNYVEYSAYYQAERK
jgi:carbonic anhydrase/acetyltransferase-like protein (isoleucine patch superfamily)